MKILISFLCIIGCQTKKQKIKLKYGKQFFSKGTKQRNNRIDKLKGYNYIELSFGKESKKVKQKFINIKDSKIVDIFNKNRIKVKNHYLISSKYIDNASDVFLISNLDDEEHLHKKTIITYLNSFLNLFDSYYKLNLYIKNILIKKKYQDGIIILFLNLYKKIVELFINVSGVEFKKLNNSILHIMGKEIKSIYLKTKEDLKTNYNALISYTVSFINTKYKNERGKLVIGEKYLNCKISEIYKILEKSLDIAIEEIFLYNTL